MPSPINPTPIPSVLSPQRKRAPKGATLGNNPDPHPLGRSSEKRCHGNKGGRLTFSELLAHMRKESSKVSHRRKKGTWKKFSVFINTANRTKKRFYEIRVYVCTYVRSPKTFTPTYTTGPRRKRKIRQLTTHLRNPERGGGGRLDRRDVLDIMHGRSRTAVDSRTPTMPGRSTSGSHRAGRHCLPQALRSAVRCPASRMKGELQPTKNRS